MEHVPVAVIDRPGAGRRALSGIAATRYARFRLPAAAARSLPERKPPAWLFLRERLHPASATAIRARGGFAAAREAAEAGEGPENRRKS
jgi:nicotinate-nucleotide adenylyltransferase